MNCSLRAAAQFYLLSFAITLCGFSTDLRAPEALIPREHHEWGRFPVGSWKKVRLVTEKLNDQGHPVSRNSSETTTTVVGIDRSSVQLRVETVVDLAGKQFPKQPQLLTQGFAGEVNPDPQNIERVVRRVGPDDIVIDGQRMQSEVQSISVVQPRCRWFSRIHYNRNVAPYVLRREINAYDPNGGQPQYQTTVEVTALDMPHEIGGVVRPTSHVRTVHTTPTGKTITEEVRCENVPGGFISHTSKQLDAEGRQIGRSTLELVEYHVPQQTRPVEPRRTFGRWQKWRWSR
mgnify:CR=1 FL=1